MHVAKWLEASDFGKLGNIRKTSNLGGDRPSRLGIILLATAVKKYAKLDIKVFYPRLILLNFFTFLESIFYGIVVITSDKLVIAHLSHIIWPIFSLFLLF